MDEIQTIERGCEEMEFTNEETKILRQALDEYVEKGQDACDCSGVYNKLTPLTRKPPIENASSEKNSSGLLFENKTFNGGFDGMKACLLKSDFDDKR